MSQFQRGLALGAGTGIIITVVVVILVMPSLMLNQYESAHNLETTVARLQKAIVDQGWTVAGVKNMNAGMAKEGVEFKPQVRVIQLCKAEYAAEILKSDRYVAAMMPCSIGVYETDEGKVMITKMNTGLMGTLFGGKIAEIMGNKVSKEESTILRSVL
jgi:uncharacterized protein (DUF302 family)